MYRGKPIVSVLSLSQSLRIPDSNSFEMLIGVVTAHYEKVASVCQPSIFPILCQNGRSNFLVGTSGNTRCGTVFDYWWLWRMSGEKSLYLQTHTALSCMIMPHFQLVQIVEVSPYYYTTDSYLCWYQHFFKETTVLTATRCALASPLNEQKQKMMKPSN